MKHTADDFITELDRAGELTRVASRVSPVIEIAALADAESKTLAPHPPSASAQRSDPAFHHLGGKALLFENVAGSDLPVLINAYGSYRRMEMALGCEAGGFDSIADRLEALTKPEPPRSVREIVRAIRQFGPLVRIGPKGVRRGKVQEIVLTGDDIDLTRLPMLQCWPLDGDLAAVGSPTDVNAHVVGADLAQDPNWRGRYFTFAHMHTIHADDAGRPKPASHNVGMYRAQLIGRRHLAMHWHMHHDGARHWRSWKKRGEPMPIAIVLGGESVLPFSAIAPLPPGMSELLFAGFLNGSGIRMVRAKTVPMRVPANAEIVIEGWVNTEAGMPGWDPRDPASGELGAGAYFEGPFGDHTGFYSLPDRYPIVEVTAITMRKNAVFPATVVGLPVQEDYFLGKAVERLFLPLLKTILPDLVDYDLPMFGAFHNGAVLQLKKEYPLQGRRLMHAVWGAGQMAWTKCVIVVDDDVNVHDRSAVFAAISEHCDPAHDVEIVRGPLDILDHSAPQLGAGAKIGFDATRKIAGEHTVGVDAADPNARRQRLSDDERRGRLARIVSIPGVIDAAFISPTNAGWLFVSAKNDDAKIANRLSHCLSQETPATAFVVLLGEGVDARKPDEALFHFLANVSPSRDRIDLPGAMLFDARAKAPREQSNDPASEPIRDWPPILEGQPISSGATNAL